MVGKSYQHWVVSVTNPEKLYEVYARTFGREAGSVHTQMQDLLGLELTDNDGYGTYTLDGIAKEIPSDRAQELAKCMEGYGNIFETADEINVYRTFLHGGKAYEHFPADESAPEGFDSLRYGTDGWHRMISFMVPAGEILSPYRGEDEYGSEGYRKILNDIKEDDYVGIEIRRDWVFQEMVNKYGYDEDSVSYVLDSREYAEIKDLIAAAIASPVESGIRSVEKFMPVKWEDKSVYLCVIPEDRYGEDTQDAFPIRVMISGTQSYYDSPKHHGLEGDDESLALRRLEAIAGIKIKAPDKTLRHFKDERDPAVFYHIEQLSPVKAVDVQLMRELKERPEDRMTDDLGGLPKKKAVRKKTKDQRR